VKRLAKLSTPTLTLIIFIFGLLVYVNSLSNGFIWDDEEQVINNPFIQNWGNLPTIFSGSTFSTGGAGLSGWYYKPLMTLWFMFNFSLLKLKPLGWHFFQIVIHLINSTLVFLVFKQVSKKLGQNRAKIGSFFAALIFAIHPANTESVVYIAASQEVLYTFFLLLIFWFLLRRKTTAWTNQFVPSFLFFLALLSKESAIIGLPLISLYLFFFDKRTLFPWLRNSLLVFLFYLYLRVFIARIPLKAPPLSPISQAILKHRLLTIPFEIFSYIRLIFFPKILTISQHQVIKNPSDPRFLISLLAVTLFVGTTLILALRSKNKLA
jgi:glycerol uptake facilitator-like aquaporin